MEESISDLYSYIYEEYDKKVPPHLLDLVNTLDLDEDIKSTYSKDMVKEQFRNKIKENSRNGAMIAQQMSPRMQAVSLARQNSDIQTELDQKSEGQLRSSLGKRLMQGVGTNRSAEILHQRLSAVKDVVVFINGPENQTRNMDSQEI